MATFTKNKQTGRFDVFGTADEIQTGASVTVKKKNGTTTTVRVTRASKPFVAKYGPLKGQQCRIGTIGEDRRGTSKRMEGYCGYPCPVTGLRCCPENGPCHDCE